MKPTSPTPDYCGRYMNNATRETYQLKVLDKSEVRQGRTHLLRSPFSFADMTEDDFKKNYTKV